jgi:hypothetical protein
MRKKPPAQHPPGSLGRGALQASEVEEDVLLAPPHHLEHHRRAGQLDAHLEVVGLVDVAEDEEVPGQVLGGQRVRLLAPAGDGGLLGQQPAPGRVPGQAQVHVEAGLVVGACVQRSVGLPLEGEAERHRAERRLVVGAGPDSLELRNELVLLGWTLGQLRRRRPVAAAGRCQADEGDERASGRVGDRGGDHDESSFHRPR